MPVPDDFDFDTWAETVELKTKPAKASPLQEFEKPQPEPEPPYDPQEDFESLLETLSEEIYESEGVRLTIGREAIWAFASRIWDAAEEAGYQDVAQCCGCTGSDKELNPFKERRESDE